MASSQRNVIAFVQPFVPSYRVGLFDAIEAGLRARGLGLEVWHDQPRGIVAARGNSAMGDWSVPTRQHRLSVRRRNVTYRHIRRRARSVRAVVAGLASTNLETYLLARDPSVRLMLWGHGRNFTARNNGLDARLERWLSERARHVFVYTEAGAEHLRASGMPDEKVSVVVNTTDTRTLRQHQAQASEQYLEKTRLDLDLREGPVALFVGAFDEPKRLPFLFEAADVIHEQLPTFTLVMAGAGPLENYVKEMARSRTYVRLAGRMETAELGMFSNLVDVLLMPGRVGLVAVDSLALGVPLATTRYPFHAPEAGYLTPANSLWTDDSIQSYANGVVDLLSSASAAAELRSRARDAGDAFSVEQSAELFVAGLLTGLSRP